MDTRRSFRLTAAIIACGVFGLAFTQAAAERGRNPGRANREFDDVVQEFSRAELAKGRQIFRYDTFGDEAWWGDALELHKAIEGEHHGGVGPGVSPATALAVGLKVDVDALPAELQDKLRRGRVDLHDPATTLALLKLNSVVGVTGHFKGDGSLESMGIQCASAIPPWTTRSRPVSATGSMAGRIATSTWARSSRSHPTSIPSPICSAWTCPR